MLKPILLAVSFAAAACVGLPAAAQSGGANYLDQLGTMDAQLAVLRKQIELRDARQLLAGGVSGLPIVSSVSGFEGDLTATLKYTNGRKVNVKRGQQLPGGMVVREVSRLGVVVRVASVDAPLEFDSGREVSAAASQEKAPAHLLPPVPQVNVPLPASLMAPPPTAAQPAQPAAVAQAQSRPDQKGK